jgi:putative membrane protein
VAISAMILPGISGSYILLIFGSYFYVTFSVKSFLSGLFDGRFHPIPFLILVVFMAGLLTGLAVLTRVLSYFLRNARPATVGALTGLMIGCLRGVWPYRVVRNGVTMNVLPATVTPTVRNGILFALVGFIVVFSLSWFGQNEDSSRRIAP